MNTAIAETRKPIQQEIRYYLPRWMAILVVITLIPQLIMFPPAGRGFWYIPGLVLMGLVEGALGGLLFVCMQRWWNPRDSRVVRIRNSVAAWIIVAVGSLWVMTAIFS
jgi:heme/copper-type cytochrome/quinol oxidase subunit 4